MPAITTCRAKCSKAFQPFLLNIQRGYALDEGHTTPRCLAETADKLAIGLPPGIFGLSQHCGFDPCSRIHVYGASEKPAANGIFHFLRLLASVPKGISQLPLCWPKNRNVIIRKRLMPPFSAADFWARS